MTQQHAGGEERRDQGESDGEPIGKAGAGRRLLIPSRAELVMPLPEVTDVAVIGGGLTGCSLAYYLARAGVDVVLLERNELNREASGTNAGSFHFQIAIHQLTGSDLDKNQDRLLADVRLLVEASDVWSGLEADLDADLGVHVTGGLMVAESDKEFAVLVAKQRLEQAAGLETEIVRGEDLAALAPCLADDLAGATYCAREGHANPLLAAPAFAARALQLGAQIRTAIPVLRVEPLDERGAARFLVHTARGELKAHRVVNAAGAWANELARRSGLSLPLHSEGLHVNVTEARDRILVPMVQHIGRRLTLKQASNGTFIIGGGWPARPEPTPERYSIYWKSAAGNAAVALRVLPMLSTVRVIHMWAGVWASSADLAPVIGESSKLQGYFTCVVPTGFTLGPLVTRMLSEVLTTPGATLPAAYAPDRVPSLTMG